MTEFCSCVIENRKPGITVRDGVEVSRVAYRCKESFESGKMLSMQDA
jgi:myo-inositol 2-dehydrogenase/D-chiro-inositol 1-dehydrogenase